MRVSLQQRITYQYSVFVFHQQSLFFQYHAADAIYRRGYRIHVKFSDILVSARCETVGTVLVYAQIELRTVLNDSLVERRQQYVVVAVYLRHGSHQITVILASIAVYYRRTHIRTVSVCPQKLFR